METVIERNIVVGEKPAAPGLSAVSWAAVFAGAVVAAAMSLILFILGMGLGLSSVSPWSGEGISAEAFGISTILWITLTSLVAAGVGGYLTGRLRTRWLGTHTDEVFFRDTAHGFLAWSVATLLTAVLFASTTAGIVSMGVKASAAVAGGIADTAATAGVAAAGTGAGMLANGDESNNPLPYYLDSLFRTNMLTPVRVNSLDVQPATTTDAPAGNATQAQVAAGGEGAEAGLEAGEEASENAGNSTANAQGGAGNTNPGQQNTAQQNSQQQTQSGDTAPALAEVSRIFARAVQQENLPAEDVTYAGRLVARHTGLSAQQAEERVSETFESVQTELRELETSAREAADEARATSAKIALWFFVALLIGAFTGSYSATIGGRQRDAGV